MGSQLRFSSPQNVLDSALELAIVPSFTKIGFEVRQRLFNWEPIRSVPNRRIIITGANSGLGFAGAKQLVEASAKVTVVARNAERGQRAVEELSSISGANVSLKLADLSSLESVRALADRLIAAGEPIDTLVHNAGALHNPREESVDGNELTLATHVIGPFLLTTLLRDLLAAGDDPRIITMSSGGLYGHGISLPDLQSTDDYSGAKAYSRAKRAQLLLNEKWSEVLEPDGVRVYTMHPGWAATAALSDSLPGFERLVRPLLRTPDQGADTLAWLASEPTAELGNGGFWLDRATRPTHRLRATKSADDKIEPLWREIARLAGVDEPS